MNIDIWPKLTDLPLAYPNIGFQKQNHLHVDGNIIREQALSDIHINISVLTLELPHIDVNNDIESPTHDIDIANATSTSCWWLCIIININNRFNNGADININTNIINN